MTRTLASAIFVVFALVTLNLAQAPAAAAPAPAAPPAAAAHAAAVPVAPALASGPAPTKIGIMNIQGAILATNEGQRDFQALEKKFEPRRTELQLAKTEIDNLNKQLTTQADKLNETALADLRKNIQTKQTNLNRSLEDAQQEWASQQNDIGNRIGAKMMEIVEKYATENGYAVILDVSQGNTVLWANAATNVTKAIVDAYNAQSNVPPPAASAPAKPAASSAKPAGAAAPRKTGQ
jgi:outer membrane protein